MDAEDSDAFCPSAVIAPSAPFNADLGGSAAVDIEGDDDEVEVGEEDDYESAESDDEGSWEEEAEGEEEMDED